MNHTTDHPTDPPPTDLTPPDDHRPRLTAVYDQTWQRLVRPGTKVVHIVPARDLRPHRAGVDCECQPQAIIPPFGYHGGPTFLHAAWDAREHLHAESAVEAQAAIDMAIEEGTGEDDDE